MADFDPGNLSKFGDISQAALIAKSGGTLSDGGAIVEPASGRNKYDKGNTVKWGLQTSVSLAALSQGALLNSTSPPVPPDPSVAVSDELVVFAGQSQTGTQGVSGAAGLPAEWAVTPRVQIWNNSTNVFATYNPATASTWGPEVMYAVKWLAANAANAFVLYLVKYYQGGTQLGDTAIYGEIGGALDWSQTSGELFASTTAEVTLAKVTLPGAVVRDVFFHQVESDAGNDALTAAYDINLAECFAAIRTQWGTANTNITTHTVRNSATRYATMTAKQRVVMALSPRNFLVDTRNLPLSDGTHWTSVGTNIVGAADYDLTHGGSVPTAGAISSSEIALSNATTGAVVGTLSAENRDGRAEVVFSLATPSSNFELVGAELRIKAGANVTASTVENLMFVATAASGKSLNFPIQISVVDRWWTLDALYTLDYANNRFRFGETVYASKAAAVAAGAIVESASGDIVAVTLPAAYTVFASGVTGPTAPTSGGAAQWIVGFDDGDDGDIADNFLALNRVFATAVRSVISMTVGTVAQIANGTTFSIGGIANSIAVKWAARIQENNTTFYVNGSGSGVDTACLVPALTHMTVANRRDNIRPWTGTVTRIEILSTVRDNTDLLSLST